MLLVAQNPRPLSQLFKVFVHLKTAVLSSCFISHKTRLATTLEVLRLCKRDDMRCAIGVFTIQISVVIFIISMLLRGLFHDVVVMSKISDTLKPRRCLFITKL